jgi:hypothetical protein
VEKADRVAVDSDDKDAPSKPGIKHHYHRQRTKIGGLTIVQKEPPNQAPSSARAMPSLASPIWIAEVIT